MKRRFVVCSLWIFLAGLTISARTLAQTLAYRQTNLSSNLPNVANNFTPSLQNPWGIAFLPGQPFFIANNGTGIVTAHDATGSSVGLTGFEVPNVAGTGGDTITAVVADPNSFFGGPTLRTPFILVTQSGNIFVWGPDVRGDLLQQATLVFDNSSSGAVYTGGVILAPDCCAPFFAAANFHAGFIDSYAFGFSPLAPPGLFTDPNLPADYAPFGMQLLGTQLFVTYAVQDAAKHDPVFGAGNGIVDIFDLEGNFVKRFVTGGPLNAPWGITQASASFGPFSNDILIGNAGDGIINAFDPATGNFVGQLTNGSGAVFRILGLHALIFRADGFGDPNALYFAASIGDQVDGVFGSLSAGLVSTTAVSRRSAGTGTQTFTATVAPGPGNTGTPTGTVNFSVNFNTPQAVALVGGAATFTTPLTSQGENVIRAVYSGDANFLPSGGETQVQVAPIPTNLTLTVPATAAPGSAVKLTANINGQGGTPTGPIMFAEGSTTLGTVNLDSTGTATLTLSTLMTGTHTVTASYAGDDTFAASTSAAVTITIAAADFLFAAMPSSATVPTGGSTQFMLTVTPTGGFTNSVTFSCSPVTGLTCTFNPATVTPANGATSTMLTVSTSSSVPRYGLLPHDLIVPGSLLASLLMVMILIWRGPELQNTRSYLLTSSALFALVAVCLGFSGCGGYSSGAQMSRGTATLNVVAQSGAVSHTTTVRITVQ